MDVKILTPEDQAFLDRVWCELSVARMRGRNPAYVILFDPKAMPISLPIPIEVEDEGQAPAAPSSPRSAPKKEFDPDKTVFADNLDETVSDEDMTGTDDAILEALDNAEKPIKIANIASRAKCNFNSHFRAKVRELVRRGIIQVISGCYYWPSEKDLPV